MFNEAELPINGRGAVYHLDLTTDEIAETILTVGDPQRVSCVSQFFDAIEVKRQHREFVTHTGRIGKKRISVVSTGIGMPNIDIAMNELDALFNINLTTREVHEQHHSFKLIRLGTTGAIQPDCDPGALIVSKYAIGFDTLLDYYAASENETLRSLHQSLHHHLNKEHSSFFLAEADAALTQRLCEIACEGITITCGGFYGPQGRQLRIPLRYPAFFSRVATFAFEHLRITNIEMETAAILGLGHLLGHQCASLSVVLGNRSLGTFTNDIEREIRLLIEQALTQVERI